MSIDEYEDVTPQELAVYADAYADRQRQTAYLQALTVRAMIISGLNGKRAPTYEAMFSNPKSENKPKDDNDLFRAVMAINQALGGVNSFNSEGVS